MLIQITALLILVLIFTVGTVRKAHIGVLALVAAGGVGLGLAEMSLKDIVGGFPVSILVLLAGVTFFFGIAHTNGTIDSLIDRSIAKVGDRAALFPPVFFVLSCGVAAMGSSLASLALAPIAMPLARKYNIDPVLMGLAIGTGLTAGAFAPTSLFGIISYGTATEAGIDLNPMVLFGIAIVLNLVLFAVAFFMFGGTKLRGNGPATPMPGAPTPTDELSSPTSGGIAIATRSAAQTNVTVTALTKIQKLTVACMVGLIVAVVALAAFGLDPDVGMLCFTFGALLMLVEPAGAKAALAKVDWSTILLVGGVITYVGVLQSMGAVDMLGHAAESLGTPLVSAFALCIIGGLVSAFASTTGMLAAIIPLALPLVASGDIPGWAIIVALAICSALVDVSPYSTVGATIIATSPEAERPRVTSRLMAWGMSMVVVGPIVLVGTLVLPATL